VVPQHSGRASDGYLGECFTDGLSGAVWSAASAAVRWHLGVCEWMYTRCKVLTTRAHACGVVAPPRTELSPVQAGSDLQCWCATLIACSMWYVTSRAVCAFCLVAFRSMMCVWLWCGFLVRRADHVVKLQGRSEHWAVPPVCGPRFHVWDARRGSVHGAAGVVTRTHCSPRTSAGVGIGWLVVLACIVLSCISVLLRVLFCFVLFVVVSFAFLKRALQGAVQCGCRACAMQHHGAWQVRARNVAKPA